MTMDRDRPDQDQRSLQHQPDIPTFQPRVRRFDSACPRFRSSVSAISEHVYLRDWATALRFMAIVAVTGIVFAGVACLLVAVSPSVRIVVGPVEFEHSEPLLPQAPGCRPPADVPLANTS